MKDIQILGFRASVAQNLMEKKREHAMETAGI